MGHWICRVKCGQCIIDWGSDCEVKYNMTYDNVRTVQLCHGLVDLRFTLRIQTKSVRIILAASSNYKKLQSMPGFRSATANPARTWGSIRASIGHFIRPGQSVIGHSMQIGHSRVVRSFGSDIGDHIRQQAMYKKPKCCGDAGSGRTWAASSLKFKANGYPHDCDIPYWRRVSFFCH